MGGLDLFEFIAALIATVLVLLAIGLELFRKR